MAEAWRGTPGGEVQQIVGGVAHRGDDDNNLVALILGFDDAFGHATDPLGVTHRGPTVFLHDQRHVTGIKVAASRLSGERAGNVRPVSEPTDRKGLNPRPDPSTDRREVESASLRPPIVPCPPNR